MIWSALELTAVLVECFIISRLMIRFFGYKSTNNRWLKSASLFLELSVFDYSFTILLNSDVLFIVTLIGGCTLFSAVFLKGKLFEKVFLSVICYLMFCFINLPVLYIISYVSKVSIGELVVAQDASRIICLILTKLIYYVIAELILIYRRKNKFNFSTGEWVIMISAFVIALLVGTLMYLISLVLPEHQYMCLLVVILITVLDGVIFLFMQKLNLANQKQLEQNMLKLQLSRQQQEMRQINENYQKISMMRHDLKNEMRCIRELIVMGKYEKALAYTDAIIQKKIDSVQEPVECSSSIINAVINTKFGEAQKKGIKTFCRILVSVPEELEFDFSIILFNLIDNAIEYEDEQIKEPQISVAISKIAGYFRIIVKNTICESVLSQNRRLDTHKKDKINHGWGLKSIKDILEEQNGEMDLYEKENEFIVSILIPENIKNLIGG